MAGTVSGLHRFADDVGPIPLALLDGNYNALQTALNTLETYSNFYLDTGTLNNINVVTDPTQYASYADGLQLSVRIANTNTGPATLNINSLGAKPILNGNYEPLTQNELVAGHTMQFIYSAWANAFVIGGGGAGGDVLVSSTAPGNPIPGQFWFNSATGRLAIFFDGAWVAATCCGASGGGATSGNLFAPPFTVGGPTHACLQVNADCSIVLGDGLTMDQGGHTWLYQGLTTYPLGGLNAAPGTPSISLHGNANATASWLAAQLDSGTTETYIGGIGGGATLKTPNPATLQILGLNGIALGTSTGGTPCMTINPDCTVTFTNDINATGGITVPTYAPGSSNAQAASTQFVTSAVTAAVNPPGGTSLTATGHTTLPSGLLFKWGYIQQGGATPLEIRINFSPAFPSACVFGIGVTLGTGIRNNASGMPSAVSASGMTILFDALDGQNNVMNGGYWLAIGY